MKHLNFKEALLHGRYLSHFHLDPIIKRLAMLVDLKVVGRSVLDKPIQMFTVGSGKTKILLWSQMHGNESTTTKAFIDVINFLLSEEPEAVSLRSSLTFFCIPMLNPDGSTLYTRENANGVDLNRDFVNRSQPETNALLDVYNEVQPDYCFNLHDQRSIYGAGYSGKPATVSFLAPSFNQNAEVNETRAKAIAVISSMNEQLQKLIPLQVGRFDDAYNPNCVGDTFQSLNTPTILVEAGHFPGDYDREVTRELVFHALITAFSAISANVFAEDPITKYLSIPQNIINYCDFVYKNVRINYDSNEIITNFAVQYEEVLRGSEIAFIAKIAEVGNLLNIYGHVEYDAKEALYNGANSNVPQPGDLANFTLGDQKFVNGSLSIN